MPGGMTYSPAAGAPYAPDASSMWSGSSVPSYHHHSHVSLGLFFMLFDRFVRLRKIGALV